MRSAVSKADDADWPEDQEKAEERQPTVKERALRAMMENSIDDGNTGHYQALAGLEARNITNRVARFFDKHRQYLAQNFPN